MPLRIPIRPIVWADQQVPAFRTYLHYMEAVDHLIRALHGDGETVDYPRLANAVRSTPGCARMDTRQRSPALYEKELRNAWFTEVALNIPTIFDLPDLVPYSNHWATVMAYYVVHHGARAALAVRDGGLPARPRHDWLLKQVSELADQRRAFPLPWGVVCLGHEAAFRFVGLPDDADVECPRLVGGFDPKYAWGAFCKALATTRKKATDQAATEWKRRERKNRIPKAERFRLGDDLPPTTVFNFLFRLRLRSNYMDADAFAAAVGMPHDAHLFNRCLTTIVSSSMMVWETAICVMLGSEDLVRLARQAIRLMPAAENTVGQRMAGWQDDCPTRPERGDREP